MCTARRAAARLPTALAASSILFTLRLAIAVDATRILSYSQPLHQPAAQQFWDGRSQPFSEVNHRPKDQWQASRRIAMQPATWLRSLLSAGTRRRSVLRDSEAVMGGRQYAAGSSSLDGVSTSHQHASADGNSAHRPKGPLRRIARSTGRPASRKQQESPDGNAVQEAEDDFPPWFAKASDGGDAGTAHARRHKHHKTSEDLWLACHRDLANEVAENEASAEKWDVVWVGDSLVEELRGTWLGRPWGPFKDIPAMWEQYFRHALYKSHALGIAGDSVEQVAWRLQHGELPATPPKVLVFQVGTNDLAGDRCSTQGANDTVDAYIDMLDWVHGRLPNTFLLVLGILPKGETWPNRCSDAIQGVNDALAHYASTQGDLVHYADVSDNFLSLSAAGNKYEIKDALMPDALHPSAFGMRTVALQLVPILEDLVAASPLLAENAAAPAEPSAAAIAEPAAEPVAEATALAAAGEAAAAATEAAADAADLDEEQRRL